LVLKEGKLNLLKLQKMEKNSHRVQIMLMAEKLYLKKKCLIQFLSNSL
jgi:hypothetical protein